MTELHWSNLAFVRPVDAGDVAALLLHLAADPRLWNVVFEARGHQGRVTWLIGTRREDLSRLRHLLAADLPVARLATAVADERTRVTAAASIRASNQDHLARVADPEVAITALLGALAVARSSETVVVQLVVGPADGPRPTPTAPSSSRPLWRQLLSGQPPASPDARKAGAAKLAAPRFRAVLRVGVKAATRERRRSSIGGVLGALRVLEAPGMRLRLVGEHPRHLDDAHPARWWWPLRLTPLEVLPMLAWPVGDRNLPGVPSLHPRELPPPPTTSSERPLAFALGSEQPLGLAERDALHHLHVLGPTGAGKSTLLLNMLLADVADGRGVVLIEPKGDLVDDLLARLPAARRADVVLLDPLDPAPLGLNPLASTARPEVVADSLVATLRSLHADSWGPRTQDVLHAGLLTLARTDTASLVLLPLLLTNPAFRRRATATAAADDPVALGPFWAWFDALSDAERATVIAPVMNKLRPFLFNPRLRAVLGQTRPRIDLPTVLARRKIFLVPLRKGVLGSESSRLLGALVVASLWQAIQSRSALTTRERVPVMVVIDEVQDYLHLPTDLGDALAQARGLGIGFTLAHQYLAQLPPAMRAAVLGTVRSRVCFQLSHDDANVMAKGHPELAADDLTALPAFHVYASLLTGSTATPYASGRTRPAPRPISDPEQLRQASRERWGHPAAGTEAALAALLATDSTDAADVTGRRRRAL